MRRHALFFGLLVTVAVAWFVILLASQTHVHSDEAIIGLMGKHILEGRNFPFYMYGQTYNAGAAWEAYVAAVAFAVLGVGVIPLKICVLVLSLLALVLFYWMCLKLYDRRTAFLSAIVFAVAPSLLKWHFQVRGYSWYFLSIPLLTVLFLSLESAQTRRALFFFFGAVSALSILSLELGIAFNIALWLLILARRGLVLGNVIAAFGGFCFGYAPVVLFNVTNHFANWAAVLEKSGGGGLRSLFRPSTLSQIFFVEMPKFFGPDTVLWYYPETPASGVVFYGIALLALGVAAWPFIGSPSKIVSAVRGGFAGNDKERDLFLLLLILACFIPYGSAPFRVPGYLLASWFFFAPLSGRLLARCFACPRSFVRFAAAAILGAAVIAGIAVAVDVARHNQIETLALCDRGDNYCMTRISGADIDDVENHLRQSDVDGVWATVSFVYPLLFECREAFSVSDTIFGYEHKVYPATIPWREPNPKDPFAIVIESDSPLRPAVEARIMQVTGAAPSVDEHGKLAVIERKAQ
jgi:hypothetical protein